MSLERIADFTLDALAFAAPIGLLFLLGLVILRRGRLQRRDALLTLFVLYLATLIKITALRQAGFAALLEPHSMDSIQLVPLITTIRELGNGLWAFLYPVLGNILWFVPLGFFLPWLWKGISGKKTCLIGLGLSLGIEILQWLLQSGISDVDDLIFNSMGACLGWWLFVAIFRNLCYAVTNETSKM